jgi:hypothetical protein
MTTSSHKLLSLILKYPYQGSSFENLSIPFDAMKDTPRRLPMFLRKFSSFYNALEV